jgi:hypothetical protein
VTSTPTKGPAQAFLMHKSLILKKNNPDVFYHQSSERYPGHTARAPPITRGGRVRTGEQIDAGCWMLHDVSDATHHDEMRQQSSAKQS